MTMIKMIEPSEWDKFLEGFTTRNCGRRSRFEVFSRAGDVVEEDEEAIFEKVSRDGQTVTIQRSHDKHGKPATLTDELKKIRGISVQYDTDNSEDMLEFTTDKNELTTLHFESRVDGDS